jgi:O-succinylbenzoate synthase
LDFNGNKDFAVFEDFAQAIPENLRESIEFVEDPVPYDIDLWVQAAQYFTLAVDFEIDKVDFSEFNQPFQVVILKPARQDVAKILDFANDCDLKLVVTSTMDHPVGIVHALRVAAEIRRTFPGRLIDCGCLTHHLYWPDDFTKELVMQGPSLVQVNGYGIGFDKLLSALPWIPAVSL